MTAREETKAFYEFVKSHPCVRCGRVPSDAAHIEGIISPKTGLVMPRSHKTIARWACVPACKDCHQHARDSIHEVGEEGFNRSLGKTPHYLWQLALTMHVTFHENRRVAWT